MSNVSIIFHTQTGTIFQAAKAIADGALAAGADVRVLRVPDNSAAGTEHPGTAVAGLDEIPFAKPDDVTWADALVFGTPTRFGNVAGPVKTFIDSLGSLWREQLLADKLVSAFTSSASEHGGQESTLLALYQSVYHWGSLILPPGYTDPAYREAGGNPYGISVTARRDGVVEGKYLRAAEIFGGRVAGVSARFRIPAEMP